MFGNIGNHVAEKPQQTAKIAAGGFFFEDDGFVPPGFNSQIPIKGHAQKWYDCYDCGNATAYLPTQCKKCNCHSFEKRDPKGRGRGIRFNIRWVA